MTLTNLFVSKNPVTTDVTMLTGERAEYAAGAITNLPASQNTAIADGSPPAASVVKSDKNHTKMELGIAFGVVCEYSLFELYSLLISQKVAFILFGLLVFFRMRRSKGSPSVPKVLKRFHKNRQMESTGQTDYFRQPIADPPMPRRPDPALFEKDLEKAAPLAEEVPAPVQAGRRSPGSYENRRSKDQFRQTLRMSMAPQRVVERNNSQRTIRNSPSIIGLPTGGPKHARMPFTSRSNPFSDRHAPPDPFVDGSTSDYTDMRPAPLKTGSRSSSIERKPSLNRSEGTTENLRLTDPRVVDTRKLVIANGVNRDSLISPMTPLPLKFTPKEPMRRPSEVAPLNLSNSRLIPEESHFSWTTKADTPAQELYRKSIMSSTSTDSNPQFRGVNSWVGRQTRRLERHPEEVPEYAKTEVDYDLKSEYSGIDTRRTFYREG